MKKLIAITGGIGSGKSQALSVLAKNGYPTVSSDQIVSSLYKKRKVLKKVKALFPTAVNGFIRLKLDRAQVAKQAFSSPDKHRALTELVTPMVIKEILALYDKSNQTLYAEVPILFESGYQKHFDEVWVITRPLSDRIESVKKRSNLTAEQIMARIKNQVDYDTIDLSPYRVILNDGDKATLEQKILELAKR